MWRHWELSSTLNPLKHLSFAWVSEVFINDISSNQKLSIVIKRIFTYDDMCSSPRVVASRHKLSPIWGFNDKVMSFYPTHVLDVALMANTHWLSPIWCFIYMHKYWYDQLQVGSRECILRLLSESCTTYDINGLKPNTRVYHVLPI